jgi:hypothetical protein
MDRKMSILIENLGKIDIANSKMRALASDYFNGRLGLAQFYQEFVELTALIDVALFDIRQRSRVKE